MKNHKVHHLRLQDTVRQLIEEGMRKGEFRQENSEDAMWAVVGGLNVALEAQLCHREAAIDREGLSRILNVIFQGLVESRPDRE